MQTKFSFAQKMNDTASEDREKIDLANQLVQSASESYDSLEFEQAERLATMAISACEEVGMLQGVAEMFYILGKINRINSNYSKALKNLFTCLEHFQTLGDKKGEAATLNQIGAIYRVQGNYPGALEYLLKSLFIYKQTDDLPGTASVLNNIGILYFYQNNYTKALEYYLASLEIEKKLEGEFGISISYINIGEVYKKMGDYKQSLDYFLKALVLAKKHEGKDQDGDSIGILYNEIGSIYLLLGDYMFSKNYLTRALSIFESLKNPQRLAECNIYLGELNLKQNNINLAKNYFTQALGYAKSISAIDLIAESNRNLSIVFDLLGNRNDAYTHYKQYIQARDSLFNEDNMKRMVQTEMLYDFEKQMYEAKIEQAKRDVKTQELAQRQRLLRNFLILVLAMTLVVVGLVYRAYKGKKEANDLLALQQKQILEKNEELIQQQEEIVSQRDEIESKNKILEESQQIIEAKNERIISSIEYAKTIQQAILPNNDQLSKFFPNHSVLFLPKDIVSGDFYWCSAIEDLLFAAVVDCTGHGVPGAFMSLIGNTMLNQIVNEWQTRNPAMILELMHEKVGQALTQESTMNKAYISMDICFIAIDINKGKATFSGASRPIYIVQDGKVERISGDARSIGGYQREAKRYFTNHSIDISKPTTLYLTTDGYIDQMDADFKKFGLRNFAELLLEIHNKPNETQSEILLSELKKHQGKQDQIDDICILGLKV
jgi:serine phosphatase RsbU (regulator of sigma subunit)